MVTQHVEERDAVHPDRFAEEVAAHYRPLVLRGQASHWPAVQAGRRSDEALADYLRGFDGGKPVEVLIGPPEIRGNFFYDSAMSGCNFQKRFGGFSALLDKLLALRGVPAPQSLYAGAAGARDHLPGWAEENPFPFPVPAAIPRVWIGNASHVSTHFDESSNVAIVVTGTRRFTLFPPDQVGNLYVGPFHFTIAGPPVSMVDLTAPDLDRYPRFAEALDHALVADLEPGDALYIPPIWWHNVQAAGAFNVMVNYWWDPPHGSSALSAMIHAILGIRDLPLAQRRAWMTWFETYVFGEDAAHAADHLPAHVRGVVGPASAARNASIRAHLARGFQEG